MKHTAGALFLVLTLALALLAAPLAADAQQQPARIAWLSPGSASGFRFVRDAFKQGLRENALVEGEHYILDERYADGHYERFPELTRELLLRNPAVMVVGTIASVQAAQQLTKTVPIVFASLNDPVAAGVVASLARPGGNTTGVANLAEDTANKQLEALRAVVPKGTRTGMLLNPGNPSNVKIFNSARATADSLGLTLLSAEMKSPDELDAAFSWLVQQRAGALLAGFDAMLLELRERIATLALKHRLPSIGPAEFADAGGLMSYGSSRAENYRLAATYVRKILAGARPAELPVEQSKRIELWINRRTANALRITIPQSLMLRADRVIE